MARLATCLEFYIHERMNNNPAWQGIKVRSICSAYDCACSLSSLSKSGACVIRTFLAIAGGLYKRMTFQASRMLRSRL